MNIENHSELIAYLIENNRIETEREPKITILKGGVSNRTVLVEFENGVGWVLKQALKKLRVKGDWFSNLDRIFREAEAMRWFEKHAPPKSVPKLVFEDQVHYLLAMEAVSPPFDNLKTLLLTNPPESAYFSQAGELLGNIHKQGTSHANDIPVLFQDNHFFQTLRLEPYYLETIKAAPETKHFIRELISETLRERYTIVHGDFSPKNLLIKDHRFVLLDHEVIHFGDGTFDLGFFMCHLLSKANHLPGHRNDFLNGISEFYGSYSKVTDLNQNRENRAVKHTIGCFLGRVLGLSPLEYLTSDQKRIQRSVGLCLVKDNITTIEELILRFKELINAYN